MSATANEQVGPVTVTKGADPNNVHPLVVEFVKGILRRFRRVRGLVRETVGYANDAFKLSQSANTITTPPLRANADPTEVYDFPTDPQKARAFIDDLKRWLREEVLETTSEIQIRNGDAWWAEFIENAYVRGYRNGTGRLMQAGVSTTAAGSVEAILNQGRAVSSLRDLYARTFEELQDVTDDMAAQLRKTLTRGFGQGWNPRKMATELNREIQDLTHQRAVTIARTETIRAASQATVDRYREAGIDGVMHAERLTAQDSRVCPFCRRIDGEVFTLDEFTNAAVEWRGQVWHVGIPSHPNGRCTPLPAMDVGDLAPLSERVPGTVVSS